MAGQIDRVWSRIRQQERRTFRQIRGGEFRYCIVGKAIFPDRTRWQIPKAHIERALELVPLKNTVPVQHLFGPSYIYAILLDARIRRDDW